MQTMKANVFRGPNKIGIEEVPRPSAGVGEAVVETAAFAARRKRKEAGEQAPATAARAAAPGAAIPRAAGV